MTDEVTNYREIMWAEMKPDLYDGEKCDQVRPQWEAYAEGDIDGEIGLEVIDYPAKNFPPGTKIIVQVPECPHCQQDVEMCISDDSCQFDWDFWRDCKYS